MLTEDDIPTTGDQESYASLLERIQGHQPYLKEIIPLLVVFVEWTQKLTAMHTPTSSLVLLAINRMDAALNSLNQRRFAAAGMKNFIRLVVTSFEAQMDIYFPQVFREFWLYEVASFLDPRTFLLMKPATGDARGDMELMRKNLARIGSNVTNLCTDIERYSEYELHARATQGDEPPQRRQRREVRDRRQPPESEEDVLRSAFLNDSPEYSTFVPVKQELQRYTAYMLVYCKDNTKDFNPLMFWPAHKAQFPIMARIAEVVLPAPSTSGDVERIFSRSGIVCTTRRNRLKQNTIEKLVFLHQAYLENEVYNGRQRKTMNDFEDFISKMTEFMNDEVAWNEYFFSLADDLEPIYFSDDEWDEDDIDGDSYEEIIDGLVNYEE